VLEYGAGVKGAVLATDADIEEDGRAMLEEVLEMNVETAAVALDIDAAV
jgi:hypothetical protein